eukprot:TRINITY_DN32689_c0_g1_i2.p1 TRINITY_DN32689_c0_g1~~TRINITY_DN32689_c0_g1_i2.p1  ORF type:complete len:1459 (-),score=284.39 TRINITY_DN32689_c0_g1_i2:190-4566(-)
MSWAASLWPAALPQASKDRARENFHVAFLWDGAASAASTDSHRGHHASAHKQKASRGTAAVEITSGGSAGVVRRQHRRRHDPKATQRSLISGEPASQAARSSEGRDPSDGRRALESSQVGDELDVEAARNKQRQLQWQRLQEGGEEEDRSTLDIEDDDAGRGEQEEAAAANETAHRTTQADDSPEHAIGTLGWLLGEQGRRHVEGDAGGHAKRQHRQSLADTLRAYFWSVDKAAKQPLRSGGLAESSADLPAGYVYMDGKPRGSSTASSDCDEETLSESAYEKCLKKKNLPPKCDFKTCTLSCCCAVPTLYRSVRTWYAKLTMQVMQFAAIFISFEESMAGGSGESEPDSKREHREYLADLRSDAMRWGVGMQMTALLVVLMHSKVKNQSQDDGVRQVDDARSKLLSSSSVGDASSVEDLSQHLTVAEQERLGGIQDHLITKVSGLSTVRWLLTVSASLGLYHALMTNPVLISICALGKTGRVLMLSKKPMLDVKAACRMCQTVGLQIWALTLCSLGFFRSTERTIVKLLESDDAELVARGEALKAGSLGRFCFGRVWMATLCVLVVQWVFVYMFLRMKMRPHSFNEDRNFYESTQASVAQYYRTGERGIIPCLSPRVRKGGMRIFFGPIPEPEVFNFMAKGQRVLRELQPLMSLPLQVDDGYPPSGSGQPPSSEDNVNRIQWMLAVVNSVMGAIGLFLFYSHLINVAVNMTNCPSQAQVQPCVTGEDCTSLARSTWFEYHLLSNKLLTTDVLSQSKLKRSTDISTVGGWLGTKSTNETQAAVLKVAQKTCAMQYEEYVAAPKHTLAAMKSATTEKFNADNQLKVQKRYNLNITWDSSTYSCKLCKEVVLADYFSNAENLLELFEIAVLALTAYMQSMLFSMLNDKLENTPMVDMPFETDPSSKESVDVEVLERKALHFVGSCFFMRYAYSGIPKHINKLENKLKSEQNRSDTTKLPDPWKYNDTPHLTWSTYSICDKLNVRMMVVNRHLLGVMEDEEVVGAWSEVPALTQNEKIAIGLGFVLMVVLPWGYTRMTMQAGCLAEAVFTTAFYLKLVEFFIIRRRPQAGFVMTSRRIFQITRQPAYRDVFGMTEPTLKLDILVHNCGLTYSCMTMESYVPALRRLYLRCMRIPAYRRGQALVQGMSEGSEFTFKITRTMGECAYLSSNLSRISYTVPVDALRKEWGRSLEDEERALPTEETPDPPCACCCCPYTPPPQGVDVGDVLHRYVQPKQAELHVYGKRCTIRPATCGELCCGRGCRFECSCCCCCQLDECINEMCTTNHRLLIEHRAVQRYCRFYACCRKTPTIRATYLAHHRASGYLVEKPVSPIGFKKTKQDLCVKLLATGQRQYQAGLMLHQRPYLILKPNEVARDKLWLGHVCKTYDLVTMDTNMESEASASDRDEDFDDHDEDADSSLIMGSEGSAEEATEEASKASRSKGKKSKGKTKSSRGKGKGTKK